MGPHQMSEAQRSFFIQTENGLPLPFTGDPAFAQASNHFSPCPSLSMALPWPSDLTSLSCDFLGSQAMAAIGDELSASFPNSFPLMPPSPVATVGADSSSLLVTSLARNSELMEFTPMMTGCDMSGRSLPIEAVKSPLKKTNGVEGGQHATKSVPRLVQQDGEVPPDRAAREFSWCVELFISEIRLRKMRFCLFQRDNLPPVVLTKCLQAS